MEQDPLQLAEVAAKEAIEENVALKQQCRQLRDLLSLAQKKESKDPVETHPKLLSIKEALNMATQKSASHQQRIDKLTNALCEKERQIEELLPFTLSTRKLKMANHTLEEKIQETEAKGEIELNTLKKQFEALKQKALALLEAQKQVEEQFAKEKESQKQVTSLEQQLVTAKQAGAQTVEVQKQLKEAQQHLAKKMKESARVCSQLDEERTERLQLDTSSKLLESAHRELQVEFEGLQRKEKELKDQLLKGDTQIKRLEERLKVVEAKNQEFLEMEKNLHQMQNFLKNFQLGKESSEQREPFQGKEKEEKKTDLFSFDEPRPQVKKSLFE